MSAFTIDIQSDVAVDAAALSAIETAATATLRQQGVAAPAEMTILLTDDKQVRALNRTYRGIDKVTDVLSFGDDDDGFAIPGEPRYVGDIAISVPQASRQAAQGGHTVSAELQLLTVHGVLHLLGHDHADDAEQTRMWAAQDAILAELGTVVTIPNYDD